MIRSRTIEWLTFQATDVSTNIFNAFLLGSLIKIPQPEAANTLKRRAISFYKVFEEQLEKTPFLAGNEYTIADISSFAVVNSIVDQIPMDEYTHLNQWFNTIKNRPAVIKGLKVPE